MEPYWNVFYDTGDPLVWLLYRSQTAFDPRSPEPAEPAEHPHPKEATSWQPPPIS